jgi:GNAT superfamily N-acetyltransferase
MNVTIRQAQADDEAFIYATFLKGLYHGNGWFGKIDKTVYFANYHKVIEALLSRSVVKVACLADEPDVVLGYSITSPDNITLHWVFVKKAWRKMGLAKRLVPPTITTVSHITRLGETLMPSTWSFNPFL